MNKNMNDSWWGEAALLGGGIIAGLGLGLWFDRPDAGLFVGTGVGLLICAWINLRRE